MKVGELKDAKRRALNIFDSWNDVTGLFTPGTGYYYEAQSIIEEAVECGAQAALGVREDTETEKTQKEINAEAGRTDEGDSQQEDSL